MKTRISTWSVFDRFGAALVAGLWLLMAFNAPALAQNGPKAAAAAKEAAENMQAYLRDLEKSGGQPDYSKPPTSEYFKRIFDADAIAALPAPQANDFDWLFEWFDSAGQTYQAMSAFGAKDQTIAELKQAVTRNIQQSADSIWTAHAFELRLYPRAVITATLYFNSLPPDQNSDARKAALKTMKAALIQLVAKTARVCTTDLKPKNLRLLAAALRDTVPVWAPIATSGERADILAQLEKALAQLKKASVDYKYAGIDDPLTAAATAIKNVKD